MRERPFYMLRSGGHFYEKICFANYGKFSAETRAC